MYHFIKWIILKEMKTSSLRKINPSTFFNLKNARFVKKISSSFFL